MVYGEPVRGVAPRTYRARRRVRPSVLVAVLALLLVATPIAAGCHLLGGKTDLLGRSARTYLPPSKWPRQGQAAIVFGGGVPAVGPHQDPAPIASLAKVMTAYLTLKRHPLDGDGAGFTMTVTAAQAAAVEEEADAGASVVAVEAGERLTERQLLEAMLIPSGNNIARMLAAGEGGGEAGFVEQMNATARALGMKDTTYTDPSGFDPGTVSTAADQLRVFRKAMGYPVFRQIVQMESATLPVVGTVTNFNPLVAAGYGGKTGSDSAAGGCLAFFTHVTVDGRRRTAVGVVMGQGEGSDTAGLLGAAADAAEGLVAAAVPGAHNSAGAFRPHIENRIRPGNAAPPKLAG
jgi:serine-type D-Ala-D-Ala carboxypeptidase (penicillin-binding protein 5/6)